MNSQTMITRFLSRLSISWILAFGSITSIAIISIASVKMGMGALSDDRIQDLKTIEFYESEKFADAISQIVRDQFVNPPTDFELWTKSADQAQPQKTGSIQSGIDQDSLTGFFKHPQNLTGILVTPKGPALFTQNITGNTTTLKIWPTSPIRWLGKLSVPDTLFYVANRTGQLVFSDQTIPSEISERPLVQEFIQNPLRTGQIQFSNQDKELLGSFQEISGTNLILFVESDIKSITSEFKRAQNKQISFAIFGILLFGILAIRPLLLIRSQLNYVPQALIAIGQGHTDIRIPTNWFGKELAEISESMSALCGPRSGQQLYAKKVIVESSMTHAPSFLEYRFFDPSTTEQNLNWMATNVSVDQQKWTFLMCSVDDVEVAPYVFSYAAGFFKQLQIQASNDGVVDATNRLQCFFDGLADIGKSDWTTAISFGSFDRASGALILGNQGYSARILKKITSSDHLPQAPIGNGVHTILIEEDEAILLERPIAASSKLPGVSIHLRSWLGDSIAYSSWEQIMTTIEAKKEDARKNKSALQQPGSIMALRRL